MTIHIVSPTLPHGHSLSLQDGSLPRDEVASYELPLHLKLQVSAEKEAFGGRNQNYILVSLMNITDIHDYITAYLTFSF